MNNKTNDDNIKQLYKELEEKKLDYKKSQKWYYGADSNYTEKLKSEIKELEGKIKNFFK
jgi:hypothetical protein